MLTIRYGCLTGGAAQGTDMTDIDPVARDYALYADRVGPGLHADLDWLEARSDHRAMGEDGHVPVEAMIRTAIREGRPLSMVRFGDGEGNILASTGDDLIALRRHAAAEILRDMYGPEPFSLDEVETLRLAMVDAVVTADILGVSDRRRIDGFEAPRLRGQMPPDIRGWMGSAEGVHGVRRVVQAAEFRPPLLVSNYIHRWLAPRYAALLGGLDVVGCIAPYDMGPILTQRFGIEQVIGHRVPNQHSSTPDEGGKWFPETFDRLIEAIEVPRPGTPFIVAAGLLAKPICARIKRLGGVGLDIGSMVDVWMGKPVRRYHDAAFLARNQLIERP